MRILLAEDNPTHREVALLLLARIGCNADAVDNGVEAVRALQKSDYDLVLMDCQMPLMDGYEATRRIRDPRTGARDPQLPIIGYTATVTPEGFARCIEAGMNDCLPKPAVARTMAAALSRWGICPTGPIDNGD